jgi:hypothetical protein
MPRWVKDSGQAHLTSDQLANVSLRTLRRQVMEQPPDKLSETVLRAQRIAASRPSSYLADHLGAIYGVER